MKMLFFPVVSKRPLVISICSCLCDFPKVFWSGTASVQEDSIKRHLSSCSCLCSIPMEIEPTAYVEK